MDLMTRYPAIADLRERARRRMPHVAWEYLDSGTGPEEALDRNRRAMEAVTLVPRFLRDARKPDLSLKLFGHDYAAPFGPAPVGMHSLMWPGTELALARACKAAGLPYCVSTMANVDMERISRATGGNFWFQLYCPDDAEVRRDLVARARKAGAQALVVTLDIPLPSRRERQLRAGMGMPPKITPKLIWDVISHPTWALETAVRGRPELANMFAYVDPSVIRKRGEFPGRGGGYGVPLEVLEDIRARWDGPLVIKGVMHPDDAVAGIEAGADGIWVSNHGGRQLDLAPAAIDVLPDVKAAVGERAAVFFDSGVRNGGDVARAVALGADAVFLGRAFTWAVAALGPRGAAHAAEILRAELANVMSQSGCVTLAELRERVA
jgi:L-lactate dehydrogenase (cytochrome)